LFLFVFVFFVFVFVFVFVFLVWFGLVWFGLVWFVFFCSNAHKNTYAYYTSTHTPLIHFIGNRVRTTICYPGGNAKKLIGILMEAKFLSQDRKKHRAAVNKVVFRCCTVSLTSTAMFDCPSRFARSWYTSVFLSKFHEGINMLNNCDILVGVHSCLSQSENAVVWTETFFDSHPKELKNLRNRIRMFVNLARREQKQYQVCKFQRAEADEERGSAAAAA
jgi:hypothetical protein